MLNYNKTKFMVINKMKPNGSALNIKIGEISKSAKQNRWNIYV